jgi:hypothetical protein
MISYDPETEALLALLASRTQESYEAELGPCPAREMDRARWAVWMAGRWCGWAPFDWPGVGRVAALTLRQWDAKIWREPVIARTFWRYGQDHPAILYFLSIYRAETLGWAFAKVLAQPEDCGGKCPEADVFALLRELAALAD